MAEERGVTLELDPGSRLPALPPDEVADLTTVLGNLVDNAIDAAAGAATDAVGSSRLVGAVASLASVASVTSVAAACGCGCETTVPGVPEDLREAIFVRGFSTKPEVLGGRGIGLPLVRMICAQRGGAVTVEPADTGGAEFLVTMPVGSPRGGVVIRVLVVDDDFMVARIHTAFVERTDGFEVVGTARTGAEALDLAASLAPDLVLLDVHLPDVSGLEVLERLRNAARNVAVVMVTAERGAAAVRAALHGGAMQYLVKPFEYDDLADRLHRVAAALASLPADDDEHRVDQAAIDQAFGAGRAGGDVLPVLPKGLSPETAELVLAAARGAG